jgi:hypothetical protein
MSIISITPDPQQTEIILGDTLPPSVRRHQAWWSNPSLPRDHPYVQAWLAAGWEVNAVDQQEEWIRFRRLG